jgi:hypothetical protein
LFSLHAQAVTGTILGTVRDASGAAVPNVSVTITSTSQGGSRTVSTDADSFYQAPSLATGTYLVSVEAQGFKKTSLRDIELRVDQKARVDLPLELGTTVVETQIRELPLNGRNFVQMTRLIPGVRLHHQLQRGILCRHVHAWVPYFDCARLPPGHHRRAQV